MITRNIKYCVILVFALAVSSCDKWLDVQPLYDVTDDELYKNAAGYHKVVNGLYLKMSESTLYGKELSWGALEAWARVYKLTDTDHPNYVALRDLKYNTTGVESYAKGFWESGYNIIAEANDLIKRTEKIEDETFFKKGMREKSMILGEAYAVRAMMHFDLARIFADAPIINPEKVSIPYVDTYPSIVNPPIPINKFLKRVTDDLEKSLGLLKEYDLGNVTDSTNLFYNTARFTPSRTNFYGNRGIRLNYLAVSVLLARAHMYAGNDIEAVKYANIVIDYVKDGKLSFTTSGEISSKPRCYNDLLFGFYNLNLPEQFNITVDLTNANKAYNIADKNVYLMPVGNGDLRKNFVFSMTNPTMDLNMKYYNQNAADIMQCVVPNIRISEAYYIVAEVLAKTDATAAAALLTSVRAKRGATAMIEAKDFDRQLIQEYRKEFLGEGQIFFFYKRKNIGIVYSTESDGSPGTGFNHNGKLSLSMPDSESGV